MPGTANDLNISETGMVSFDGTSIFHGRTLTAGTGITITNGNGVSGNPVIALTGGGPAVEHLTGDSGGALNPVSNNFNLVTDSNYNTLGGVGVVTGSGNTLTFNLTRALSSPSPIGNTARNTALFTSLGSNAGQTFSNANDTFPSTTITINSTGYSAANQALQLNIHGVVPGSIVAGFGTSVQLQAQDTNGTTVAIGELVSSLDVVTPGSTSSHTDIASYVNNSAKISISAYPNYAKIPLGQVVNYTGTSANTYVVLATDYYISVDCSGGAKQVNLPNAPPNNQIYIVKDKTGSAATHNITVTTVGGAVNIDGATTFIINLNYGSVNLIFNGTSYEIF